MTSISMVKIKDWVVPYNPESYKILSRLGLTHTRIKLDVFDTVKSLRLDTAGVSVDYLSMNDIWVEFLDQVARRWKRVPSTKFSNNARMVTLETLHGAVYDEVYPKVAAIEQCFSRFFTRWGSSFEFTYSESRNKIRLHFEFRHGDRNPVFETRKPPTLPKILDFDTTRIVITNDPKSKNLQRLEVQVKAGSDWKIIHASRFVNHKIMDTDTLAYLINSQTLPL